MKCFYHSDMDGKCAGSIVARVTGNYNSKDYIMYNYDGEIPTELIEDGETVYFVDLSFSVNTVDKLKEIVAYLRSMSPLYEDFIKKHQQ